ncbi:MAG: hypothetical protein U1F31_12110 [Steroidobacteraceae bacterium]|jgi:hypothetical protein
MWEREDGAIDQSKAWGWEMRPIADREFQVLVLRMKRPESIRVALPPQVTQQAVEQALADAGVHGAKSC